MGLSHRYTTQEEQRREEGRGGAESQTHNTGRTEEGGGRRGGAESQTHNTGRTEEGGGGGVGLSQWC